jgi:hypothetical protein
VGTSRPVSIIGAINGCWPARLALALALTGAAALASASGAFAASAAAPDAPPPKLTVLGDAQTTLWAHAGRREWARVHPDAKARRIARLRFDTEDGFPEIYVVLRSLTDGEGRTWVKIRLPMRPNHTRGWVQRSALGAFHRVQTKLTVSRTKLSARLYRRGRLIWSAPVGVGKSATPTPRGNFYIRERFRPGARNTIYGTLAFGTSAYSRLSDWPGGGVVGIHGTNRPGLIPGRPSHGCIRMRNRDIERLGRLMPLGTPVRIT